MNTTTFPPKAYPQADKSATNLSVSAGITRLRRLGDGRLKAYIKDHEAWALIVLAILLIAGTVLYVDFQPRLDAGSGTPQNGAVLKLAEAPVQQRPSDELFSPLIQETPSAMSSSISNPPSQPARLISSGKRDHQLIKRKAIHHHLRR